MIRINFNPTRSGLHNTCGKSRNLLHFPVTSNVTRSEIVTTPTISSSWAWGKVKSLVSRPRLDPKALPLAWLLNPAKGDSVSERVLARLVQSQAHEANPHLKTDYYQAWLTVYYASLGNPIPFIEASYKAIGCHPDKVWPRLIANRKALLGKDYEKWYDAAGMLRPEKKPVQSVGKETKQDAA